MRTIEERINILTLWEKKLTRMEICNLLHIPWRTVDGIIQKYKNVETIINEQKYKELLMISSYNDIIDCYCNKKLSIKQIMKKMKLTRAHINEVLNRNNVSILSSQEYAMNNSLLGTKLNYFNEYTQLSTYVLGLIYGDGCVHYVEKTHKYYVNLTSEDLDILKSFNHYFNNKFEIKKVKTSNAYKINIWSKELCELLFNKYKLRGKKSHNLLWPNLPDEMYQYFISGLHSTDGSNFTTNMTSKHKNKIYKYQYLYWGYTSVCEDFIKNLKIYIDTKLSLRGRMKKRTHTNGSLSYSLEYSHKNAIKLCDWMYNSTNELTRCKRKYEKYLSHL